MRLAALCTGFLALNSRIVLAGYATNGDIMLWELINTPFYGRERGEWKVIDVIKNNQAEPLECAFPSNKDIFISAYTGGSIVIRPFADNHKGVRKRIETLSGIDAGVFRWKNIKCDDEPRRALEGYEH